MTAVGGFVDISQLVFSGQAGSLFGYSLISAFAISTIGMMVFGEMCGRVADRCVQLLGGYGFIADNPVERFYRDVRLFRLYEGTSQIHQLNIARRTYGLAGHDLRG